MKIGVIGGNGVAATNRLCELIERKLTAFGAYRDAHHPEMVIWQATSAPSRSMFLEGRGPDWRPAYIRIAKNLRKMGCDLGCMCCNTAHYAVDEISFESGLPFINLLDEVAVSAKATGLNRFEIFCSDGLRKYDLYGKAFGKVFPAAEILYPSQERQKLVTQAICAVKNKVRFLSPTDVQHPANLLNRLIEGASVPVILGCTDLRVAYSVGSSLDAQIAVDSLECLADVIISKSGASDAF